MAQQLFSPAQLGSATLSNHIVMAPMTRSRATVNHLLTDIMVTYYAQRATAGLIISEGVSPSANGTGYARIPGIYNSKQVAGWKKVTEVVHQKGGKIFAQLMHSGRIGHPLNLPQGAQLVGPSAVAAAGEIYTDQQSMQPHPVPHALTTEEVRTTIQEFVQAAQNAIEAGFDGIELHGANGYLIEQFLNPASNQRTDQYGGSVENRSRFLFETTQAVGEAIGFNRVGVRLSPYNVFNDMALYPEIDETYTYLAEKLNSIGIVYIHLIHPASGQIVETIRDRFKNTLILNGSYTPERAEATLQSGKADLIAFGRSFIANPDLVERLQNGIELAQPDFTTFYTPGEKGYIDYPAFEEANV